MSCIGQSASLLPAAGLSAAVVASDGGRGCRTRQPRSRCRLQETRVGLQEGRGPSGPRGPGVAFRHPRSASFRSLARIGSALARVGGAHPAGLLPAAPPHGPGSRDRAQKGGARV